MKKLRWFGLAFSLFFLTSGCKSKNSGDWMDRSIARDFERYEKHGISKDLLETSWQACQGHKEFQRFQIIDSKVYGPRIRESKFCWKKLLSVIPFPDVDFIYYYEDRLKADFFKRKNHRNSAPVFVSAKNIEIKHVILFADWNYNIRNETGGWNFLIKKVNEEYSKLDWSQKIEKLLWRGTPWDGKHFWNI